MNDRQNTVVATGIVGLILVVVFLCPWRVDTSDEIRWSPIYQPPMHYVRTYDPDYGRQGGSRIEGEDAQVAVDVLVLEMLAVGAATGALYVLSAGAGPDERRPPV